MNQQPDKFFHDKLHGYQKPASGEAWNRIASNLQKKRRDVIWMRAAAAVALLATASILLYPRMAADPATLIAEKNTAEQGTENNALTPSDTATHPQRNADAHREPIAANPDEAPARNKASKPAKQVPKQKQVNSAHEPEVTSTESVEVTQTAPIDIIPENNVAAAFDENTADRVDSQKSQKVTIVFTAEEVNEKYLVKNSDAEATPETEETSGLKKLLDKAYDLKHNRDFLGELRQKKNEILAMNFKNEKRTQND